MTCLLCRQQGKTWDGDDPKCAFPDGEPFDPGNWNCATMNALRDLARKGTPDGWFWRNDDDDTVALVRVPGDNPCPDYIVMTFYKERGRVDRAHLIRKDNEVVELTEDVALACINGCKPDDKEQQGDREPDCNCEQALELKALVEAVAKAFDEWHTTPDQFVSEELIEACGACCEYLDPESTNPTEGE